MNKVSTLLVRRCCVSSILAVGLLLRSAGAQAESVELANGDEQHRAALLPSPINKVGQVSAVVATSLITPLFGAYYVEGSVRLASRWAVLVNASRLSLVDGDWTSTGNTVGAGLTYFFQGAAFRRWYVQGIGEVLLNARRHEPSGQAAAYAIGGTAVVLAGYSFVHDLGPVLDLGAGAVLLRVPGASVETSGGPVSAQAQTIVYPALKVSVGWAF